MHTSTTRNGTISVAMRTMVAALALSAWIAASAPMAGAIPPEGASPDTPGTSATVSPSTLAPGATISFTVSGFPAGETLNVKIDDGLSCSQSATHGACVYHQQAIPASGTVKGRFTLPADIGAGPHWLRFLASETILDANGNQIGVKGFTARGNSDFTVVVSTNSPAPAPAPAPGGAAAQPNPGASGSVGSNTAPTGSGGTNPGGTQSNGAGTAAPTPGHASPGNDTAGADNDPNVAVPAPDDDLAVAPSIPAEPAPSTTTTVVGDEFESESASTVTIDSKPDGGAPVVGIVAVAGAVLVAAAGGFVVLRRRT